jgi:hypothetical protein
MNFGEIRLIIAVCIGIAVSVISASKGAQIIQSALGGFVSAILIYAVISWAIEALSK